MMKLKAFSIIIFSLIAINAFGQYRLTGTVASASDSLLKECIVFVQEIKKSTTTDASGRFEFTGLPNGTYHIHVNYPDYKTSKQKVVIEGHDVNINVSLSLIHNELDEVTVTEKKSDFGFTHMKGVDGMGLYEGKKSEVIIPDQLVANLATNNAREVYSRVAGLNIYENDGAGIQLSIGGRGLDPNRTGSFNVRQNGYDISADALGYPESYYTPPVVAVDKIQIVRGAASLQYGTQFGGLLNFVMKKPVEDRKIQLIARQSAGSFGFSNTFASLSGTVGKFSYYTCFQYKTGNGWRPNTHFDNYTYFGNFNYQLTSKAKISLDITQMGYLAQQPGGLTDLMFSENPRQSNRERNWFKVNWTLMAMHFDYKFNSRTEFNIRAFGLSAYRYSIGFNQYKTNTPDDNTSRNLITGRFTNWGTEARFLKRYTYLKKKNGVLLVGSRYYYGFNKSMQGRGTDGRGPDFSYVEPEKYLTNNYTFPNHNYAFFAENIFYLHEKLSVTPGFRYENIFTRANGYFGNVAYDNAGNVIYVSRIDDPRSSPRQFILGGIGISYKPNTHMDIYGNISQNYRSITFSDMHIANPAFIVDPNLKDETGYSADLGIRSEQTTFFTYDVNAFYLNYNNRIGEVQVYDLQDKTMRMRTNIGQAIIMGIESYAEADVLRLLKPKLANWSGVFFTNLALIHSTYQKSLIPGVTGNYVEFVPNVNLKTGIRVGYKGFKTSIQYTYLSDQYSDASNATEGGSMGVVGLIPAYEILDLSMSYEYKKIKFEGSINNMADRAYYTRRATGYPGPGIIPSNGRAFYLTLQVKI